MNPSFPIEKITPQTMAQLIDHTLLKPDATPGAIDTLCDQALEFAFKSVCVNSCHVARAADRLKGSAVLVCSVIGFPLGAMDTKAKAFEAERAVDLGATELDMVMNIGGLKSGDQTLVLEDISTIRKTVGYQIVLKVIIETCCLTEMEKKLACEVCKDGGADFVKTSTGFSTGGATCEDVALMRKTVGAKMGVKASGGIKDWHKAVEMIRAGANRIGAGAGLAILKSGMP